MPSGPEPGSQPPGTDARGTQGMQLGGGNTQHNYFYAESQSVVWPRQVGSVPSLADCYQQREPENAGLDEAMTAGTVVLTQVLSGLGGVGKTQLAASYARRVWTENGVELLVWATASSRASVQATYAQAAAEIGRLPAQDVERAAEWFVGWLQNTSRRWLVVLDALADPADLQELWPTGPSGRTVVTTRRRDAVLTDHGRRLINVGLYTPDEAVAYLQNKLGAAGSGVMAEAAELADDLGHLPLALGQAASFIRDRGETCAGYRRRLGDRRHRLSEILPEDALADDYRSTVAATWSISVDLADKLSPVGLARPVLQFLSTLDPNGVPLDIMTSPAAQTVIAAQRSSSALDRGAGVEEQDCRDSLTNLHRLNLISFDPAGGARAIRTHALVQRATLEGLSTDVVSTTVRAAADALVQVWPDIERDTESGRALRDCAANLWKRHGELLWEPDGHEVLFRAGHSLGQCGLVRAAVDYWTEMETEATDKLGVNHSKTLNTRQNLAWWQGEAGDPAGAAVSLEQLLKDGSRVLGDDHPDILNIRNNLAYWRGYAGDPAGAAAALEQVLTDRQRMLGPDHPDTLLTRNNLARWRGEAGDPAGALPDLEGLLADYLRVLGPDHPDTLDARHTLAYRRGEAGDPAGAVADLEKLVADHVRVLGPDRPTTLITRNNLARWRGEAGDPAGAVADLEQLVSDYLRVLGPDHPTTLDTRDNLARWRGEAGDPAGAVADLEQLLTDYLQVLGPDHPDTLTARGDLADLHGKAGDPAGAAAAYQQLLTDRRRVLGASHNHTLGTRRALARWRAEAGDQVSIGVTAEPGAPHPSTDARGAQGVQSGEGNLQINVYAESRSVVWPHQVGSVPLLADCYQRRERETAGLDEAVSTGTVVLTQVLSGLGGVGKTQLAASYARRIWAEHGVELLVWATASSRAAVQATYAQAAADIGRLPAQEVERAAEWFVGWLQTTNRSWLVVLDDVADPADLRGLWPTGTSGRAVITTRRRDAVLTGSGRRLINVGLYTATEAVTYLEDKLGAANADVMDEAVELAADLDYLPLALAQAASFIRDRGETCAGYRRRLADRRHRLSEILPEDALADDYRAAVAATWSISVDRADALVPGGLARPVLQFLSTLDPNGVPLDIVTSPAARTVIAAQRSSSASDRGAAVEEQDCRDSLRNLHRLNLISFDKVGGARAISTHALVQRATLEGLSADAVLVTVRAAADALVQVWPDIERDTELGRVLRDCSASLRGRHGALLWDPDGHAVLFRAGRSLGECGLFGAAVDYWTQMATKASAALGPDHPHTLTTRRNVAYWQGEAGDHAGAAAAFEELLIDCLRVLGADHPDTLRTRGDLAYWRGVAGDPAGAAAAFEELLPDCLRVLGADHPDTLGTRRNLANWRGAAGDPAGAAAAFEQLLPDCLRVLGTDHPDTLTTRDRLAFWRGAAGDHADALAAFEQLCADRLRVLGADHPDTLTSRGDHAYWRGRAGDPAGAVAAYEQLLADRIRVLGADHPHTLGTRHALAIWRGEAGDSVGAVESLEQVLTDYLRVLGPDHLDTRRTRHTLAVWRGKVGDSVGAIEALEQVLTDCLRVLGPNHPDTLSTRQALAS